MLITVFRSRLNSETLEEYQSMATQLSKLVAEIPGYISHKGFVANDGERVTIVEFSSEEGMRAWAKHPLHVEAKKKGRSSLFTEYHVQVCKVLRDSAGSGHQRN
ncbi:antibiotic biosynthesis monooxygenase family protein [Undibacterium sp. Di27W]|uniref:antibiotic biosynthesis monooxygenase family protein n=1 Tax=Undibacterium sp. Di27W TaxID=3413036 RepID=UPI003BEFD349